MNNQPKKLANLNIDINSYNTVRFSPSKYKHTNKKSMTPTSRQKKLLQSPRHPDLKVREIKQVQKVKKGLTTGLHPRKMKEIAKIIQVQQNSERQYLRRLKTNSLYLNYNKNPFLVEKQQTKQKSKQNKKTINARKQIKEENIIEAIQKIKARKHHDLLRQKINQQNLNWKQLNYMYETMKQRTVPFQTTQSKNFNISLKQMLRQIIKDATGQKQLDEIVSIKQENFFKEKRNREPFDIFQLITNPNSIMFQSGYQQLQYYKFSFSSMSTNIESKFNETCIKNLSTFARTSALKLDSKTIPDEFYLKKEGLTYDVDELSSSDMLLIAKGQLTPKTALKYLAFLNDEKEQFKQNRKMELKQQADVLLQTKFYKAKNTQERALTRDQIQYYKNIGNTSKEQQQGKISRSYLQEMKVILRNQIDLLNKNIVDTKVQNVMNKKKDVVLINQLENNLNYSSKFMGNQKKIRLNKLYKDQTQKIKIDTMTTTLKYRKETENLIKSLTNFKLKSKSKSKSKTNSKSKQLLKCKYKKEKEKLINFILEATKVKN